MKHAPLKRALLLCCLCLLLTACGDKGEEKTDTPPPPAPSRNVPDDVPLYYEDSDAKKLNVETTDEDVLITMETINGPLSPITYYRALPNSGWEIVQDTANTGGTLLATKRGRELELTFEPLPAGAGTSIILRTTKEE